VHPNYLNYGITGTKVMKGVKTSITLAMIFGIALVLSLSTATGSAFGTTEQFAADLLGNKEIPPVQTQATGTAGFTQPHLNNMSYGLRVNNISGVSAAHIHLGPEGQNGPVIVTLFKADNETGTGPVIGRLVGGSITNSMLEGPMAGKTLEGELAKAIQNGQTYVNIHTVENPDGAIRGQIIPGGAR
jgi:hypothetical protein